MSPSAFLRILPGKIPEILNVLGVSRNMNILNFKIAFLNRGKKLALSRKKIIKIGNDQKYRKETKAHRESDSL